MHHTYSQEVSARTSITLPRGLLRKVVLAARGSGRSASSIIREALERYFRDQPAPELPSFVGIGDSGYSDTSDRTEDLIAASFRRKRRK